MFGLNSTSIGYEPCRKRKGSSMVPLLTRDLSPLATDSRSWFVSHAQTTCFDAYGEGSAHNLWHGFALRFEPSPRARAHPSHRARSLRAMHRLLRVDSRRTLACTRPDHIQSMLHGSRCARPPGPCTLQLHPKSKIRSLSFQPTPARALHCSNSRAHTRMFWARDDRGRKPPLHPLA